MAGCSARRTGASRRTRCGSIRWRASSWSRTTSAGPSPTMSTPACRWPTSRSCTPSSPGRAMSPTRSSTAATPRCGASSQVVPRRIATSPHDAMTIFDDLASVMRAQAAGRRLRPEHIDDATVLSLLELARHATADRRRRCEFVVVRDPDIRHQLARTYRQGWSIYKRVLRTRSHDDAVLEARQWESDHFEDVPVLIVACVYGRRPLFPAAIAAAFYASAFPAVQNLLLAAGASGLGASATTLPLWSAWEARRTLGLPRRVTPVAVVALGWPRGGAHRATTTSAAPFVGNVVHLDRWGHQPFRARRASGAADTA